MKSKNTGIKLGNRIKIILFSLQGGLLALKLTAFKGMSWFLVFSPIMIYISLIIFLFLTLVFAVMIKGFIKDWIRESLRIEKEKNGNKTDNSPQS